jgi:predicted CoA-binding protein
MAQRVVVIVGASRDRAKYGNKSVRAHMKQGWRVIPVNPAGGEVEGLPAVPALSAVQPPVDRVSMYVPAEVGVRLVPEIARIRPAEFFLNPGSESDALVEAAQAAGLDPILACSIVDIGQRPSDFGP